MLELHTFNKIEIRTSLLEVVLEYRYLAGAGFTTLGCLPWKRNAYVSPGVARESQRSALNLHTIKLVIQRFYSTIRNIGSQESKENRKRPAACRSISFLTPLPEGCSTRSECVVTVGRQVGLLF